MTRRELTAHLDGILGPLGFARSQLTWNRRAGEFIDVIDIQFGKARPEFAINVGVLALEVCSMFEGQGLLGFVEESRCNIRTRMSALVDGRDKWWPIEGGGGNPDISAMLADYAIPFLDRMHSLVAMKDWLVAQNVVGKKYPPPIMYLAIIDHRLGNAQASCFMLGELRQRSPEAWGPKIDHVLDRLGCK